MEYSHSGTFYPSSFCTFCKIHVSDDPIGYKLLSIDNISCFVLLFCMVRCCFLYRQNVLLPIPFVVVFPSLFFRPEKILLFDLAFWPFSSPPILHPLVR